MEDAKFLSRADFVDLGGPVAAGSDVFSVGTEANAADDTLVLQGVDQVHIQAAGYGLVEDDPPVVLHFPGVGGHALGIKVA